MLLTPQLLLLGLMMALGLGTLHAAPPADEVKLERGSCPTFWHGSNGRCYKYSPSLLTWGEAEKNCVSQGANLASVHSQEEHDFVRSLIKNFGTSVRGAWIGLSDNHMRGWWSWSDGAKVSYTAWLGGEPQAGRGCVATEVATTKWLDLMCDDNKLPSVCEIRTVCP